VLLCSCAVVWVAIWLFFHKCLGEIAAQRDVVEAQTEVCDDDARCANEQCYVPRCTEGINLLLYHPHIKEVHQRIVDDVKWIGNVAEKLANGGGTAVGGSATSS